MSLDTDKTVNVATVYPYSELRSSTYQRVRDIEDINDKWVAAYRSDRNRLFDNLRAYFSINGGSWEKEALADLQRQGRHPVSFPIAHQKIQTLAGSIQSQKFDFDYFPLDQTKNKAIEDMKYLYHADENDYNYKASENVTLLRGLVHSGYEEMEIRYDIRPTGGIGFAACPPGQVIKDPYWQTHDPAHWRRAIKHAYFSPREIIERWGTRDADIRKEARMNAEGGEDYFDVGEVDLYRDANDEYGSKHLVIEYRELRKRKTTRLHGRLPGGGWVSFPLDVEKQELDIFMSVYGIESYEDIVELPYEDDTLWLETIVPSLTRKSFLFHGKHNVQCGGIGLFKFSACSELGVDRGVMDSIVDIQRTLDYRESKKDDIIASGAAGGLMVNKEKFENPPKSLQEIKENRTRPDYVLSVDGNPSEAIQLIPNAQVDPAILNDIMGLIDMFDRVSPVVPAMEGAATKNESGILFELRHAVAKLGTLILYDNWQQHLKNKAVAWYVQARDTYKDVYREALDDLGENVEYNSPIFIDTEDGRKKGYSNSVSALPPRAQVIVTLKEDSPSEQHAKRFLYFDMAKMLSANPEESRNQLRVVINEMIKTLPLSAEEKKKYKAIADMQQEIDTMDLFRQREELKAAILNDKVLQKQASAMLGEMGQGQQQPTGGPSPVTLEGNAPNIGLNPEDIHNLATVPGQDLSIETSRGEFTP